MPYRIAPRGLSYTVDEYGTVVAVTRVEEDRRPVPKPKKQKQASKPLRKGAQPATEQPRLVTCSKCGWRATPARMRLHRAAAHAPREPLTSLAASSIGSRKDRERVVSGQVTPLLVVCPVCRVQVREDRLERHVERVHGRAATEVGKKVHEGRRASTPSTGRETLKLLTDK